MGRMERGATTSDIGGRHVVIVHRAADSPRDVTILRNTPIGIGDYTSADPFGDTTFQITLPQVGILEDLSAPDLSWIHEDTLVDIWWVPAAQAPEDWNPSVVDEDSRLRINPLSELPTAIATNWEYLRSAGIDVRQKKRRGRKVWEGYIADISVDSSGQASSLTVSCQGALFQADLLLAKPFYPPRPVLVETLIGRVFDTTAQPSLRLHRMRIDWPVGWTYVTPSFTGVSTILEPNVRPRVKWTGYTSRNTGSWDHALTSYIQGLLAVMIVKPNSGGTARAGDQWTLRLEREDPATGALGRTPVLTVRTRAQTPRFSVWAFADGVEANLHRDSTQGENVLFGTGTDLAGTTWRNSVISRYGNATDYLPLVAHRSVYPHINNPALNKNRFKRETYVQYTGFSQVDATETAVLNQQRDLDPGWSGSITLKVDPSPTLSRWEIAAGDTMTLKGFLGSGVDGKRFHIAEVSASPEEGKVVLTVDTRYRDLLTLNEAIQRTRDALTPAKLLQLNRNSVTIEDIQAPWDYGRGSGCVPQPSVKFQLNRPTSSIFPHRNYMLAHPPRKYPSWYVACHSSNGSSRLRWAGPIRVLMSEKGNIRRSEFVVVDRDGQILPIPFHVSLYYSNGVNASFMPKLGSTYSPFIPNAFQSIDPTTGQPWAQPGHEADQSMVIGWGNKEQPAGYSPGLLSRGARPTGLLVDESSWPFDCSSNNPNYDHLAKAGKEPSSVISVYAMFYAHYPGTVYFMGRLFREEPGAS